MKAQENVSVMRAIFDAIERRDLQRLLELIDREAEFHWPPPLPYAGVQRGLLSSGPSWVTSWMPLQPTEAERRMDARVVAATDDEVVILWRQRGRNPRGETFDGEVLGLYRLRSGRLARAQMFY